MTTRRSPMMSLTEMLGTVVNPVRFFWGTILRELTSNPDDGDRVESSRVSHQLTEVKVILSRAE